MLTIHFFEQLPFVKYYWGIHKETRQSPCPQKVYSLVGEAGIKNKTYTVMSTSEWYRLERKLKQSKGIESDRGDAVLDKIPKAGLFEEMTFEQRTVSMRASLGLSVKNIPGIGNKCKGPGDQVQHVWWAIRRPGEPRGVEGRGMRNEAGEIARSLASHGECISFLGLP